jgi:hypothetical protein
MSRMLLGSLLTIGLAACNPDSGAAAAPKGKEVARETASLSLRIVRRVHPDATLMLEAMAARQSMCMTILRAQGVTITPPAMPSPASISKLATAEVEELYFNGMHASFSYQGMVVADVSKACQWVLEKTLHAEAETICGHSDAGHADAPIHPDAQAGILGAPTLPSPELSEDAGETDAQSLKQCRAEASRPAKFQPQQEGRTSGGQRCLWVGNETGVEGPGLVEPVRAGQHYCVHPRQFDGSLMRPHGGSLLLRALRVVPPDDPSKALESFTPESNFGRMEAEIVEEGKAVPASRFTRAAVEQYLNQPRVVPLEGSK